MFCPRSQEDRRNAKNKILRSEILSSSQCRVVKAQPVVFHNFRNSPKITCSKVHVHILYSRKKKNTEHLADLLLIYTKIKKDKNIYIMHNRV